MLPEIRDKSAHSAPRRRHRRGAARGPRATRQSVAAWALVHGLSALLIDGQLTQRAPTPEDAEALTARVTALLQTGLAPAR